MLFANVFFAGLALFSTVTAPHQDYMETDSTHLDEIVTITTAEGSTVDVPISIASHFNVLTDMLEKDAEIPLPQVTRPILKLMIDFVMLPNDLATRK